MTYREAGSTAHRRVTPWAFGAVIFTFLLCGCTAKVDGRFAPETYDEYSEPLTNAVIGSPGGVVTIAADGGVGSASSSTASGTGSGISSTVMTTTATGSTTTQSTTSATTFTISSFTTSTFTTSTSSFGGDGGPINLVDGGMADGGSPGGFGFWHFDDCSPTSNFLVDSSGFGANAQHALGAACVAGISGLGVDIRSTKDVIQVPDEPQFTVGSRVAVAAWVHPNTVTGHQPIVIKRLNNQTAFSLGIHDGNIEMSVVLTTGTTVISRAPIKAGTWTHVAGMFDGTFVFLFVDGQQFGQVYGAGTIRNVFAPLRIGATTQTQHFDGIIDEVFVSTEVVSASTLEALACISRRPTLTVSPVVGGPAPFDTPVHFDIKETNNDVGFCPSSQFDTFVNFFNPNISVVVDPLNQFATVAPGATLDVGVDVTGGDGADPGSFLIPFTLERFGSNSFDFLSGQLDFELAAPTGCFVFQRRELMITSPSVVDDPVRTAGVFLPGGGFGDGGAVVDASGPPPGTTSPAGVWTFGQLARDFAPSSDQAPAMVEQLLDTWLTDQTVNGFTVAARPAMRQTLLDVWPRTASGQLDLDRPPLTLQAIVARVDLRDLSIQSAGEGRFVFAVNGFGGFPLQFTVILEYNLPAQTAADVQVWANRWHALSSHPFPSEEYNAALEALTRSFTGRGASPLSSSVNGSNLFSLRTNEIALSGVQWELRQFQLAADTTFLREIPVAETPDLGFNGTSTFADFVNQNEATILALVPGATANTVPAQFEGAPFQGGSSINGANAGSPVVWNAPGINNPDARFHASINTCNGCHGPDTNTFFLQITPRSPGGEATLSSFLTGTTAFDPFTGQARSLNDLARRKADLTGLVCGSDAGIDAGDATAPPPPLDAGPGGG